MADPKLLRIVKDVASRLSPVLISNGYYTDIGQRIERGNFIFNQENTPAIAVFLQEGSNNSNAANGVATDTGITIRASHVYGEDPEDLAIKMLADIHKAVEIKQSFSPSASDIVKRLQEDSWQITYPEDASNMVAVEVNYSFNYSRKYGED